MGGFFGVTSKNDCLTDVFFGTDYHSHLGSQSAGLAAFDKKIGLQRKIRHIDKAPFKTKFQKVLSEMHGTSAIGSINDGDPQPLLIHSKHGPYSICFIGNIINKKELVDNFLKQSRGHFDSMTGGKINSTELVASLIDKKENFEEGIKYAQNRIKGTANIIILTNDGNIIAARDKLGRLPVQIGKHDDGMAVSFESYAYQKLGFYNEKELGPGEIVLITPEKLIQLKPPQKKKQICSFLWSYYGFPTTSYEGKNVEVMRYKNGMLLAKQDEGSAFVKNIDYVGGVPDSGTPHAIGYSNYSKRPFARAFIKYTPTWTRSFISINKKIRNKIAKMKQIPIMELIKGKELLFVDDSIVRGTQLQETVEFLYHNGAKAVHMRSACPPIMYGCKFLNFMRSTGDMELISRRTIMELEGEEGFKHIEEYVDGKSKRGKKMRKAICDKFGFASLEFQSIENVIEAIGLNPCDLCTYCWNGKE